MNQSLQNQNPLHRKIISPKSFFKRFGWQLHQKKHFFQKVCHLHSLPLAFPNQALFFNHLQLVGSGLQPGSWASLHFFKGSSFSQLSLTQLPEKTLFKTTTWLDMISKNETYLCFLIFLQKNDFRIFFIARKTIISNHALTCSCLN